MLVSIPLTNVFLVKVRNYADAMIKSYRLSVSGGKFAYGLDYILWSNEQPRAAGLLGPCRFNLTGDVLTIMMFRVQLHQPQ